MSEPRQILELMPKLAAEVGAISKDHKVSSGPARYSFRGIDDVMNKLGPACQKLGITLATEYDVLSNELFEINGKKKRAVFVKLKVRFTAPDGSATSSEAIGEGLDTSDKAIYKAMSGAFKYSIFQTLAIPLEDGMDPEKGTEELGDGAQPLNLSKKAREAEKLLKEGKRDEAIAICKQMRNEDELSYLRGLL